MDAAAAAPKRKPVFKPLKTKGVVDLKETVSAAELQTNVAAAAPQPFKSAAVAAAETAGGAAAREEQEGAVIQATTKKAAPAGKPQLGLAAGIRKPVLPPPTASPNQGFHEEAAASPNLGLHAAVVPRRKKPNPVQVAFSAQKYEEETKNPYLIADPPAFIPPTRRGFVTFFDATFHGDGTHAADFMLPPRRLGQKDLDACKKLGASDAVEVFKYQQFIREYLRLATPYRGLLVYHGLGSGKTCSSIAAAEALFGTSGKKIIVMTPGSLRGNFQAQISFCGFRHYRLTNHWSFLPITASSRNFALTVMNIPQRYINAVEHRREEGRRGFWVPNFEAPPNYKELDPTAQTDIRNQITAILEDRIEFINYNGISANKLKAIVCADGAAPANTPGHFDNKVIIIDEIHNLSRLMQGQIHGYQEQLPSKTGRRTNPEPVTPERWIPRLCAGSKNYKRAFLLFRLIAEARNSKIIGLSGTPLINFPDELGPLMDMIAGYTHGAKIVMKERTEAAMNAVRAAAAKHPRIDYVDFKPGQLDTEITITCFLDGYVKTPASVATGNFEGLMPDLDADGGPGAEGMKGPAAVARELMTTLSRPPIPLTFKGEPTLISYPLLPVNPKEFNRYFVDENTLEAKNVATLKKRLYGLVSYYRGASEDLMPAIVEDREINIIFSEYSLQYYTRKRVQEIAETPSEIVGAGEEVNPYDDIADVAGSVNPSNYRFNSRAACNFAFPSQIPRPYQSLRKEEEAAAAALIDDIGTGIVTDDAFDLTAEAEAEVAAAAEEDAAIAAEEAAAVAAMGTLTGGGSDDEAAPAGGGGGGPTKPRRFKLPVAPEATSAAAGEEAVVEKFLAKAEQEAKAAGFTLAEAEEEAPVGAAGAPRRIEPYLVRLDRALKTLRAQKDRFLKLDGPADSNLMKYSPKFATMIRTINDPEQVPGSSLVYSQFLTAEGLGIFGYALEANGYKHIEFTGSEANPEFTEETKASMMKRGDKRFMYFTGAQSPIIRKVILDLFNGRISQLPQKIQEVMRTAGYEELGNKSGEICKVIGITGAGAEGISLKFVRGVHIMEPYWNDVRLEQVKGRAVRICSHAELPPEDRTVSVFTYFMYFSPADLTSQAGKPARVIETLRMRDKGITSDQKVLELSKNKKKLNSNFLTILKEVAVDCTLNSADNERLVCYEGPEGNPKETFMVPDLAADLQKSLTEQRVEPAKGAGGAGPAKSGPTKGTTEARRIIRLKDPATGNPRELFMNTDPASTDPNTYLAYELSDVTKKRPPVARIIINPATGKARVTYL